MGAGEGTRDIPTDRKGPRRGNTCAILVTYHPGGSIAARLAAVARQVGRVLVVDNGSGDVDTQALKAAVAGLRCDILLNPRNLGIAAALNQGMNWADARGYDWTLTLDQDSDISDSLLDRLGALHDEYTDPARLAVIGANFRESSSGNLGFSAGRQGGPSWRETIIAITSGSLIAVSIYRRIGPFRDDFFLDHVDTEYCLRARTRGYKVIVSKDPLMTHSIGSGTIRRIFGFNLGTSNHSPSRRYYGARNFMVLAREHWTHEPKFILRMFWSLLKSMVLVATFEADRFTKLRYGLLGLIHGVRGKMGPLSDGPSPSGSG